MIDLHTHILPGVDDGPATMDESVEMARTALADGVDLLAATPHVRDDYPTSADTMERLVGELCTALKSAGMLLEIRSGGEIALDRLPLMDGDELRRFSLGGSSRYLLIEFPYIGWPLELGGRVLELATQGMSAVLAHPERNREVQESPERLRPLVEAGALVQVTAASLGGRLGSRARVTGLELFRLGLAHVLASDAHMPAVRGVGMTAAVNAIKDKALARWLTEDAPTAILADEAVPPRPVARRRWLR